MNMQNLSNVLFYYQFKSRGIGLKSFKHSHIVYFFRNKSKITT